ncbi:NAD(P)-binding protein [Xylaria bambusicola]|uniref:NAD(P)-binding protein n=1 Tax=Xylaria bambusicola TaxID=326684 RepID=UPI002007A259|nr:NAD(P)-binding protein [Xylaria bambusicola]KAI0522311.1 NAD(P)-binding protein [Xylaria bambusicola]
MNGTQQKLTWLVTGSSNGIGLALVRYILNTGDNVIATSRNPSKTPELVKEVESHLNGRWITLDISWPQDKITRTIEEADILFEGGINAIVNNATFAIAGAIEDIPEEDAKAEFDINVWGTLRVCKAILPLMRQRGRGTIVQISSLLGLVVFPALGIYSASKFALEAISEAISQETSSFGIRTLIVNLGSFRTNFLAPDAMPVHEPSEPYKAPHAVAVSLQNEHNKHGKQPGDPEKAVKIIHDAVSGRDPSLTKVLRLPLGEDCWGATMARVDQMRNDIDGCKEAACSTNHST